jgi:hypothetical protein
MGFMVLDFIAALNDLIEEGEIDQFDEMTAEDMKLVKARAKQYTTEG